MKYARLLHNPLAGDGSLTKRDLIEMIQSAGFGCSYSSTKKVGWEKIEARHTDFVILAGGDGTVRKVAASLLNRKVLDRKFPIGLLPTGTANNIAKTLGILSHDEDVIIKSWKDENTKKFDVGRIFGVKSASFFLESFGFGVFPELMRQMRQVPPEELDSPEKSLETALRKVREIIEKAHSRFCKISLDGIEHKGNFLLVEIMNTSSIGPQLKLAPLADPADGHFDIVMIAEKQREAFLEYVDNLLLGRDEPAFFELLRAQKMQIVWDGSKAHVDDEIVRIKKNDPIEIELRHGLLEFLVPKNGKQL